MTLEQITNTFSVLDERHVILAQAFVPVEGSDLAEDDQDWPPVRLSQVAVMGLGSARDHLHGVRLHLEARQLLPFAQLTLIRGALVGAAQAVWVLAPDDRALRLSRGRCVVAHMYAEQAKYLRVLRDLAPEPHAGTDAVAALVDQRHAELGALRRQSDEGASLNTTAMVHEAASAAFDDRALADEVLSIWRLTSGAAHGFAWALLGQAGTTQAGPADPHGIASFEAAGDVDRIANQYLAAFHLARRGMTFLARRSEVAT